MGVQELEVIPIVESITKYAVKLKDPQLVRYELEKCVAIARRGRPGPVLLDVPLDVQATSYLAASVSILSFSIRLSIIYRRPIRMYVLFIYFIPSSDICQVFSNVCFFSVPFILC